MSELKPCPFCGLSSSNAFPTGREAIAAWNERNTLLSKVKKVVKAWLKKKLKD